MAGDWLKLEITTPDKPEVFELASLLMIDDHDTVFAKLVRVWIWFDQQTENGEVPSTSKLYLDRVTGIKGFCDAMITVGWMYEENKRIWLPNFDRHNGVSAKKRIDAARRKAKSRSAKTNVTENSDKKEFIGSSLRSAIYKRDNYQCVYCGFVEDVRPLVGRHSSASLSLDHVVPESRGGVTSVENLVTCCTVCNQEKGNKTPQEAGMIARFVTKKCDIEVTNVLPREEKRIYTDRYTEIGQIHTTLASEGLNERWLMRGEDRKTMAAWIEAGLTGEILAEAVTRARYSKQSDPFGVAYLNRIVEQLIFEINNPGKPNEKQRSYGQSGSDILAAGCAEAFEPDD